MIELETQFQLCISSIVFSMFFTNIYTFIDIIFSRIKILKGVLVMISFICATLIYYYLLFIINKGKLTIYIPLFLLSGYYLHMKFYDKYFSCLYQYLFLKIHSIIIKNRERCKRVWKELMKKKIKKVKSTE